MLKNLVGSDREFKQRHRLGADGRPACALKLVENVGNSFYFASELVMSGLMIDIVRRHRP